MKRVLLLALLTLSQASFAVTVDIATKADLDAAVGNLQKQISALSSTPTTTTTQPAATTTTTLPSTNSWKKCADEGGTCVVSGTVDVRYGLNGVYVTKSVTGSIACTNAAFGRDPVVGLAKICESSGGTASTPTTSTGGGIFIGTQEFAHLADAGAAYKSGDTIKITKSLDNEATALVNGDVNVVCDPGVKLTWSGGLNLRLAWGKGIFNVEGATKNFSMTNCEISGAQLSTANGANGAAVRLIDGIDSATFTNVNFHDNNNGILGAAKKTVVTGSKFYNNGMGPNQDGHTHNVYFSAFADVVTVTNSYFGPNNIGNVFKSRAKSTLIDRCQFETKSTLDSSYVIDMPNGGTVVVKNSVLLKAPNQSQRSILSYGVEGLPADGRVNTYEFANNLVINDGNANFMNGTGSFNFHDNTLVGPAMSGLINMTNLKVYDDRASAGLPAAPALPSVK